VHLENQTHNNADCRARRKSRNIVSDSRSILGPNVVFHRLTDKESRSYNPVNLIVSGRRICVGRIEFQRRSKSGNYGNRIIAVEGQRIYRT